MSQPRSKIFIEIGDQLLFSLKRAPKKPLKDHRLELIGGKQEPGETPFQALIRELQEEEASGILAQRALANPSSARTVDVSGQLFHIYRMELDEADGKRLIASDKESYGFELIPKHQLESTSGFQPERFTPKTLKVFRALNLYPGEKP